MRGSSIGRRLHRVLQRLGKLLNRAELRDVANTSMREVAAGLITGEELVERLEYVAHRRRNQCLQYSARGIRCDRAAHLDRAHVWVVK